MDNNYFKEWFSKEQMIKREIQLALLYEIFKNNNQIIFKGGTALDLFYNSGRFSEDLDFDLLNKDGLSEIDEAIENFTNSGKYTIFNNWENERDLNNSFVRYYLKIASNEYDNVIDFVIDCSLDKPFLNPDSYIINYRDSIIKIPVMAIQEIVAEKVSAILSRKKARDLYDLYYLVVVKDVKVNMKYVYMKCKKRFSAKKPEDYSFNLFEKKVKGLKNKWAELEPLLNDYKLYNYDKVSEKLLHIFRLLSN